MKRFTMGKAVAGAAVAAGLLVGAATPNVARAHDVERVEGDWAWVRYTTKGAHGPLLRVRRQDAIAQDATHQQRERERREAVAGSRIETDEQGRRWMYAHPRTKGAVGTGWVRVPLQDVK